MNSFLLVVMCNLAVALSASINQQPRGLSAKTSGSLAEASYGYEALKRRQEPTLVPAGASPTTSVTAPPSRRSNNDAETIERGIEHAEGALIEHYAQMKKNMKQLKSSFLGHKEKQAKVQLDMFFENLNETMVLVQAYSEDISSLTGVSKVDLDTFFAGLSESLSELHSSLEHSDHKLELVKTFFAQLIESVSQLNTSSVNTITKSEHVKAFFTTVIHLISSLDTALEFTHDKAEQAEVLLKRFFAKLGDSMEKLEGEMQGTDQSNN